MIQSHALDLARVPAVVTGALETCLRGGLGQALLLSIVSLLRLALGCAELTLPVLACQHVLQVCDARLYLISPPKLRHSQILNFKSINLK